MRKIYNLILLFTYIIIYTAIINSNIYPIEIGMDFNYHYQSTINENKIIRYYKNRIVNNDIINWKFSNELDFEDLSQIDYYYKIEYEKIKENNLIISKISIISYDVKIFEYDIKFINALIKEEKYYDDNSKIIFYYKVEKETPFIIAIYKDNKLKNISMYDEYSRKKITEIYDAVENIQNIAYFNENNKIVLNKIFKYNEDDENDAPKNYIETIEINIYDDILIIKNILLYPNNRTKKVTVYDKEKKIKLKEYKYNLLQKIYYFGSDELLSKIEFYDITTGKIIYYYYLNK